MKLQELKKRYSFFARLNEKIMDSDFAIITEFAAWTVGILIALLFGGAAIYGTAGTGTAGANLLENAPIILTALAPAVAIRGVRGGFRIAERRAYDKYATAYNSNQFVQVLTRGIDKIVSVSKEGKLNRAELDKAVDNLIVLVKKSEKNITKSQEQQIEQAVVKHVQEITKDLPQDRKRILGEIFKMHGR